MRFVSRCVISRDGLRGARCGAGWDLPGALWGIRVPFGVTWRGLQYARDLTSSVRDHAE